MGLGNIAGYFSNLKNGFDQIGEQSYHLNVDHHVYVSRETDSPCHAFFKPVASTAQPKR